MIVFERRNLSVCVCVVFFLSHSQIWVWTAAGPPCSPASPSRCSGRRHAPLCPSPPPVRSPDASLGAWSSANTHARTRTRAHTHTELYIKVIVFTVHVKALCQLLFHPDLWVHTDQAWPPSCENIKMLAPIRARVREFESLMTEECHSQPNFINNAGDKSLGLDRAL